MFGYLRHLSPGWARNRTFGPKRLFGAKVHRKKVTAEHGMCLGRDGVHVPSGTESGENQR